MRIQQEILSASEAGDRRLQDAGSVRVGVSCIRKLVGRAGWKLILAWLLAIPMASYEQDGPKGVSQRRSVAVLRSRDTRMAVGDCCAPLPAESGSGDAYVRVSAMPDSRSLELADREMVRNHAERGVGGILPSLSMPLIEEADADMDLMFRMAVAGWTSHAEAADTELDTWFRMEHIQPLGAWDYNDSDHEMNRRFRMEQARG